MPRSVTGQLSCTASLTAILSGERSEHAYHRKTVLHKIYKQKKLPYQLLGLLFCTWSFETPTTSPGHFVSQFSFALYSFMVTIVVLSQLQIYSCCLRGMKITFPFYIVLHSVNGRIKKCYSFLQHQDFHNQVTPESDGSLISFAGTGTPFKWSNFTVLSIFKLGIQLQYHYWSCFFS